MMPSADKAGLDIIVIGAGIGGLSAAISCSLGGHRVTVLERARELTAVSMALVTTGRRDVFNLTDAL